MELILVELRAVHVLSDFVAYEVNGFPIGESFNESSFSGHAKVETRKEITCSNIIELKPRK